MFYVIIDTKGAGRIVGIFDDPERATNIVAIDPAYFRVVGMPLNSINPTAIDWLNTPGQRHLLKSL